MSNILIRAGCFVTIIFLGFILKKRGLFQEKDFTVLSNTVMKVTFPAAIITNFAGKQIDPSLLSLAALAVATRETVITRASTIASNFFIVSTPP